MIKSLSIQKVSKKYNLGAISFRSFRDEIRHFWLRFKDFSRNVWHQENTEENLEKKDEHIWALKNVSFEVCKGDVIGIIGRNGAGKSTLLKILSRVTAPTSGTVKIKGRLASLLEVGTGFHPELTGRENIFLNGAILGMKLAEIELKFDEIVEFAGVTNFLDTPVKRYSSGMYVRLAFAVAANLDADILLIDEVLAVGDLFFQKKCLKRVGEISASGRTVLFVSHNLETIRQFCNRGIVLQHGEITFQGSQNDAIKHYTSQASKENIPRKRPLSSLGPVQVSEFRFENEDGKEVEEIPAGEYWNAVFFFEVLEKVPSFIFAVGISTETGFPIRTVFSKPQDILPGKFKIVFKERNLFLETGRYIVSVGLSSFQRGIGFYPEAFAFMVSDFASKRSFVRIKDVGLILNPMEESIERID